MTNSPNLCYHRKLKRKQPSCDQWPMQKRLWLRRLRTRRVRRVWVERFFVSVLSARDIKRATPLFFFTGFSCALRKVLHSHITTSRYSGNARRLTISCQQYLWASACMDTISLLILVLIVLQIVTTLEINQPRERPDNLEYWHAGKIMHNILSKRRSWFPTRLHNPSRH